MRDIELHLEQSVVSSSPLGMYKFCWPCLSMDSSTERRVDCLPRKFRNETLSYLPFPYFPKSE